MRVLRVAIILIILLGAWVCAYEKFVDVTVPPSVFYAGASRGDVVMTVTATGTLQASRTVDVGTQVSGVVKKMYVDYNSIVRKGDLIAEIDPILIQAALDSAQAAVDKAEIDLQGAQDTLVVDAKSRDRAENMYAAKLETQSDRETAELQVKADQAVVDQDKAAIIIAQANVEQAKVNLGFCTIRSPIDGVVVTRNADEGQTVASGFAVPSLYIIAYDIEHLWSSRARSTSRTSGSSIPARAWGSRWMPLPGPDLPRHDDARAPVCDQFEQRRHLPGDRVGQQPGPAKLLPSMTATMKVEVGRASDVVRVPNTALRFRPSHDIFDAFQEAPLPTVVPPSTVVAGTAAAAHQATLPLPTGFVQKPGQFGVEIDTLFQAAPAPRIPSLLWFMRDGKLESIPVMAGISDGTLSELVGANVQPGDRSRHLDQPPEEGGRPGRQPVDGGPRRSAASAARPRGADPRTVIDYVT